MVELKVELVARGWLLLGRGVGSMSRLRQGLHVGSKV